MQCFPNCVLRLVYRYAAGFFKILNIYTSLQPKASKFYHKVMVDHVEDRVLVLCCPKKWCDLKKNKVIDFSLVMLLAININRFMWLLCAKFV